MARSHEIPHERTSPKDERTFAPPLPAPLPAATIDRGVAPRFVALVAQALGCRHCWIRLVGSDGDVLTDDAFDALHDDGAPWSDLPRAPFDDERIAFRSSSASMHLPVELADGTAGEVVVAGGTHSGRRTWPRSISWYVPMSRPMMTLPGARCGGSALR